MAESTIPVSYASKSPQSQPQGAPSTPPMLAQSTSSSEAARQRRGTDPSKFKTSMCRNWESTGNCSFRGCTFAHGHDELRMSTGKSPSPSAGPATPPFASAVPPLPSTVGGGSTHSTPHHGPQQPPLPRSQQRSTPSTQPADPPGRRVPPPQMRSAAANRGEVNHSDTFEVTASAVNVPAPQQQRYSVSPGANGSSYPSNHTPSFGMSPPMSAAHPQPVAPSSAPPPPPYAPAAHRASSHRASHTGSPVPQQVAMMSTDQTVESIVMELTTVRELCSIHADANSALEVQLAKERGHRRDSLNRISELKIEAARLRAILDERRSVLTRAGHTLGEISPAAARSPLTVEAGRTPPTSGSGDPGALPPAMSLPATIVASNNNALPPSQGAERAAGRPVNNTSSLSNSTTEMTSEAASTSVASPTDPVQQDRLRMLLQQLDISGGSP